jgi:hypothetical protein
MREGQTFIWVRETVEWSNEGTFLDQADSAIRAKAAVWNDTFTLPFHRFRERVAAIAALSHSRVRGAELSSWDQIPRGALVLPTDDDDWFAPGVAEAIAPELSDGVELVRWGHAVIEVPLNLAHRLKVKARGVIPAIPRRYSCATNNYAVVKSDPEHALLLASRHVRASAFVDSGAGQVRHLTEPLSLMNRTLGSQTSLGLRRPTISRDQLLRRWRRYRRIYRRPLPPGLQWARPYTAMMDELMGELQPSR